MTPEARREVLADPPSPRPPDDADPVRPVDPNLSPAEDELTRLRAQVRRLTAERDLLKKAAAYFANPPT